MNPGLTLLVGAFCGLLSSFGYCYIQPFLHEKINLHDTCGINNLHGMPSIAGALISIFVAGIASDRAQEGSYFYKQDRQALAQFAGLVLTLAFAVCTGLITGKFMQAYDISEGMDARKFHDAVWWELGAEEESSIIVATANHKKNDDHVHKNQA
jgi:ammonium transporter Rh